MTTTATSETVQVFSLATKERVRQGVFIIASLLVVLLIGLQTWSIRPDANSSSPGLRSLVAYSQRQESSDADIAIIYKALRQKPTFLSTFGWWHEKWAGPFRYWRPLTSQGFWLEYRAFGPDRFDRFFAVTSVSHLTFTALLSVLTTRLTKSRWAGLLTAYLFAGARTLGPLSVWVFGVIPSAQTIDRWKNEPEVWAGICTVAAILLALSGRWGWSVAMAALSICFKESGWMTWPLVFLTLVPDGRFRTIPRWVYGVGASVALLLFGLRCTIGWDIYAGNTATHNVNWISRYWQQVGGSYLTDLTSEAAPLAVFSLSLALLAQWRRGPIIGRVILSIVALLLCAAWYGKTLGCSFETGLGIFLDWSSGLDHWLGDLSYLAVGFCLLRNRDFNRPALLLIALILVSALPYIASVLVGTHTLYLTYGLQSALVALALVVTAQTLLRWGQSLRRTIKPLGKPKESHA